MAPHQPHDVAHIPTAPPDFLSLQPAVHPAFHFPMATPVRARPSALTWEADVAPFPDVSAPGHLAAIAIVAADGVTLRSEQLQLSPRPQAVVATLQQAVDLAMRDSSAAPERLVVRDREIAEGLGECLDLPVETADRLPTVDAALASAAGSRFGLMPLDAVPWVAPDWASWGLDSETLHQVFAAAASFYRAAPWRTLGPSHAVAVAFRERGTTWFARVLGRDGEAIGLCLYEALADLPTSTDPGDFAPRSGGRALALNYCARADIGAEAWRLIRDNFWPVAGDGAVPRLRVWNTPYGIDQHTAWELATVLGWLPEIIESDPARPPERWRVGHWVTQGVTMVPLGDAAFPRRAILAPALPKGPGARPAAALVRHSPGSLSANHMDLVARVANTFRDNGQSPRVVGSTSEAVRIFLEDYLAEHVRIPVTAVTDYDLRQFIHTWLPTWRKDWATSPSMSAGLAVLFAGLWHWRRVHCPWASRLLDELRTVEGRWAGLSAAGEPNALQAAARFGDEGDFADCVAADLRCRFLVPDWDQATTIPWADDPGPTEADLRRELCRRWLLWREEFAGTIFVVRDEAWARLQTRQHQWENRVHPVLGCTPREAVLKEQGRLGTP